MSQAQVALTAVAVHVGIPGYEELGEAMSLTMFPTVNWWAVEAYDQRSGLYGLLIYDETGTVQIFLSNCQELDALCALIEFCVDVLSYWTACPAMDALVEEWRSIWWAVQNMMARQQLREIHG